MMAQADAEADVMRVFVAGGSGVLGRRLVTQLVARGHQVTATTTSADKLALLAGLGRTAGNESTWRHGSSPRSGTATSTVCGSCSRTTWRCPGTGAARRLHMVMGADNVSRVLALNPDKLRHIGPLADAWAVNRELRQARRSGD